MSNLYSAEDLEIPTDIANATIMDMPSDDITFLLLQQKADRDPRYHASRKRYIDRMLTTKMHILLIILPKIFEAFPSEFRSLLSALELTWEILLADCNYRCKEVNPYLIMLNIARDRWATTFRNTDMSSTLLQRINKTKLLLREANIDAYPIQDYLTIHFTHRSAAREEGILSREPTAIECRDGGKGTDARIVRIITDDASPMRPLFTIVPGHLNIQYAIAKRSRPDESEYTPGLRTGDPSSDMLQCIYGDDGFDPEKDEENMDMLRASYLPDGYEPEEENEDTNDPHVGRQIDYAVDDDKHNDNLQTRNETHNQRMKRIADTCDKERDERKKLKLEMSV